VLGAGLLAFAQKPDPQESKSSDAKGSSDRMRTEMTGTADQSFVMKAAQGGMAEVQMGQLAKDHGSSQAVKDFGQHMIDDHSKANDELKNLVSQKNVTLPTDLDAKDKATYDRLSKLNGAAFDKAYMRDMVNDHKKDVAEFQKEANSGKDPDVKAWASKTVPTLQNHRQMAETTRQQVMSGNTSAAKQSH
jgi:putative membrane protein